MKKSLFIFLCFLYAATAIKAQAPCESVTAAAFAGDQSGAHNYFGVRVTLAQAYSQDVTVTGYIHKDADENGNTDHPFTLTITAGSLTAETAANFYETDPAGGAAVTVASVSPCPISEITATYAGVVVTYEVANHILRFNSASDYNAVADQLDADYDTYNDTYDNQYLNLTSAQLDDVDATNNFDEFKKFKDFENLFSGFVSKRSEIENTENSWLSSAFITTDPDDVDLTFDDAMNTLFNNNYSVKVGSDIYQLSASGLYLNGNLQANVQDNFKQKNFLPNTHPIITDYAVYINSIIRNYKSNYDELSPSCKTNKKTIRPGEFGDDKYKLKVALNSIIIRSGIKSKVVHYAKKNGNWQKARAKMASLVGGTVYDNNCSFSFQTSLRNPNSGWKNRRRLKVAYHKCCEIWRTYTDKIAGSFDTNAGHAGTINLQF